jgi:hypothetical protein
MKLTLDSDSPQSDAQETFAGTPGKDKVAPIPAIR